MLGVPRSTSGGSTNAIIDTFITDLDEPGEWGYIQYLTVGPDGTPLHQ